jgi:hypothetical protein
LDNDGVQRDQKNKFKKENLLEKIIALLSLRIITIYENDICRKTFLKVVFDFLGYTEGPKENRSFDAFHCLKIGRKHAS